MKKRLSVSLVLLLMVMVSSSAYGLNILVTNDDGFDTPNIKALHAALQAEGHDVIISAPFDDQSAVSAMVTVFKEVAVGSADENVHYVKGSPAMAVLHGIDVVAKETWGRYPDLVISGPNQGNNLGVFTAHSGTVGAAIVALYRGIPAIAVSAAGGKDEAGTQELVAQAAVKFINALVRKEGPILQPGTGINLNIPSLAQYENIDDLKYVFTEIGTSSQYIPRFTMSLGDDPFFQYVYGSYAAKYIGKPGVSLAYPDTLGSPAETAKHPETQSLLEGKATISVINVSYAAGHEQEQKVRSRLQRLVSDDKP